ncbi:uncharacterized protein LOC126363724 isoform X4 [Schistocerca gregaria]|uniref:uncharacterized protein LOC126363724 isoform X4 n=1 Tax=Schistocerca gregaria TaxID=7010 RepID=UPI00211EF7DE|nr:uncharacterized protein LOC126363724 isoform X4 [Schistocerca gregaria]
MFIKIKYADDKELLANPDCRIGSLLDYVKATMAESELFDTELHNEIDLCDDYGRLLNVNDVEPCKNGLELRLFQPRATYFVFLISRDEDGKIASIVPTVTDMGRTVGEVANRLRQQITKSKIKVHDFGLIGDILFLVFKNMYINLLFKLTRFNMIKFSTVNLKTKSDRCKQSLGG